MRLLVTMLVAIALAGTLPAHVAAAVSAPTCDDGAFQALVERQQDFQNAGSQIEAEHAALQAADLRLECALTLRGDDRATVLDDFAAQMETAAADAVAAHDFADGCTAMHRDIDILQGQLQSNQFSRRWTKALQARVDGASIYRSMCEGTR